MKPFKPGVVVTKERLGFTQLPETDAEGQVAVRQFQTQAPIGPGQAGVVNAQGAIPAVVEYKSMAGELANSVKSSCAHCVAEGTLVFADGRLLPIERAVAEGAQRTFLNGEWISTSGWASGKKDVVEVTTTHGLKVRMTPDHRVLTHRGWVHAIDLRAAFRPGGINDNRDEVVAPVGFQMAYTDAINRESALLVGAIVGDGWVSHVHGEVNGAGFCYAKDMETAWAPLLEYARDVLGSREVPRSRIDKNRLDSLVQCLHPQEFFRVEWRNKAAKALGLWLDKDHVPKELWSSTPGAIGAYLRGLFSTDGSIGLNPRPTVRFYQTSISLVMEVQILLRSIGIHGTVTREIRAPRYKDLYQLVVARHDSLERFIDLVGFVDDGRRIPLEQAVMARRGKDRGSPERVKSVVSCGVANVYDLSVPGPESFLANGLTVHNCKHFDVKAWRQFVAAATGPAASVEAKQTIQTMKARIMMAGYGFEDEDGGVERTVMHHGVCRPLSDWVEAQVKRDPVWWPVVCWKEASCPSYVRAGSAELPVVTPAEPLGFFTPRDLDAEKQGEKGYDNILFNAAGKPR